MSWVRTSDDAPDHPKLIGLTDAAYALWHRALSYCNRQLTDGFVPSGAVPALSRSTKPLDAAKELVTAKLWEIADGGFQVHDFADYQPSRASVEEERRKKSEDKQRAGHVGGKRSAEKRKQRASRPEAASKQTRSSEQADGLNLQAETQAEPKQNEAPDPDPDPEGENPPGPPSAAALAATPGSDPDLATSPPFGLTGIWPKDPALGSDEGAPRADVADLEAMARHAMTRPAELTPYERSRVAKVHARLVNTLALTAEDRALIVEVDTKLTLRDEASAGPRPSSFGAPVQLSGVSPPPIDFTINAGPKREIFKTKRVASPTLEDE